MEGCEKEGGPVVYRCRVFVWTETGRRRGARVGVRVEMWGRALPEEMKRRETRSNDARFECRYNVRENSR